MSYKITLLFKNLFKLLINLLKIFKILIFKNINQFLLFIDLKKKARVTIERHAQWDTLRPTFMFELK